MTKEVTIIPRILDLSSSSAGFPLDETEIRMLQTARRLFDSMFFPQCLLEFWSASIHNLRRRVEAYSIELFQSVVKDEGGRKSYNEKGDSLSLRWENVDDLVLIQGAKKLGLVNGKAAKTLEMINWMRNHASSAHETDEEVNENEVLSLASLLQESLFSQPLPSPGHSVGGLFKPVKEKSLGEEQIHTYIDQIRSFKHQDIRTCFGFLLDILCLGEEPGLTNIQQLLPACWEKTTDDLKKIAGFRYHSYDIEPDTDESLDKGAKTRLLEFLMMGFI